MQILGDVTGQSERIALLIKTTLLVNYLQSQSNFIHNLINFVIIDLAHWFVMILFCSGNNNYIAIESGDMILQ
jgi:large-conductance mechanosensitive channel